MSRMADAKPGGSFADCVIDHHELVNNEASHPDVFFYVDDKTPLTAHYYVLKSSSHILTEFLNLIFAFLIFSYLETFANLSLASF